MKLIIAGGRDIDNYEVVKQAIQESGWVHPTYVIGGGATGVDALGKKWALENVVPYVNVSAKWDTEGKAAGPKRNKRMAEIGDALVLVWDGKSKGSMSMLNEAKKAGLKIHKVIIKE